jgi:hypothetical protein
MQLSEMPALKEARDKIARGLHKRNGGDYLSAVNEANAIVRRSYRRARGVAEGKPRRAPKPAKKDRKAVVSEAVSQAVSRALSEALTARQAAPAATARPVAELTDDELAGRLAEVYWAGRAPGGGTAGAVAESVTELPDTPLHELDHDSFMDLFAAAAVTHGQATMASPFFAGAGAAVPPFMRGLRDG